MARAERAESRAELVAALSLLLAVVEAAGDYMRSDADTLVMISFDKLEHALAALEAAP